MYVGLSLLKGPRSLPAYSGYDNTDKSRKPHCRLTTSGFLLTLFFCLPKLNTSSLQHSIHYLFVSQQPPRVHSTESSQKRTLHASYRPPLVQAAKIGRRRRGRHQDKGSRPLGKSSRKKMGAEHSNIMDGVPPKVLSERSLSAVSQYIKDGRARHIVVMTGAGLSTAAGSKSPRCP